MRYLALLLLFCWSLIGAKDLQILQIVPFGDNNVRITFDRKISPNDLKQKNLSNTQSVLDINAVLTIKRKNYLFSSKTRIQISQQNKKIVRVLIQAPKEMNYSLRFSNKNLYIEFDAPKSSKKFAQTKQRRVVLDPGHGGKDCGAIGVLKVCEKIVTLKVAKLLETELKKRGYVVYMTRDQDRYLGLQERTNFANNKRADLFISIHANSIPKTSNKEINGVETYFLSTARSERARRVAEKENKDSIEVMNFFSKQTFLNSINTHRLIASNKLAIDIQGGILKKLRANYPKVVDGGVREGPFWVLAGALMPSVLIEIGYMSHPQEGRRITHREYQANLASGIADGVDGYFEKNP